MILLLIIPPIVITILICLAGFAAYLGNLEGSLMLLVSAIVVGVAAWKLITSVE